MVFFVGDGGGVCRGCSEREAWAGHFFVLDRVLKLVLGVLVVGSFGDVERALTRGCEADNFCGFEEPRLQSLVVELLLVTESIFVVIEFIRCRSLISRRRGVLQVSRSSFIRP